jgi:hypothetical protein
MPGPRTWVQPNWLIEKMDSRNGKPIKMDTKRAKAWMRLNMVENQLDIVSEELEIFRLKMEAWRQLDEGAKQLDMVAQRIQIWRQLDLAEQGLDIIWRQLEMVGRRIVTWRQMNMVEQQLSVVERKLKIFTRQVEMLQSSMERIGRPMAKATIQRRSTRRHNGMPSRILTRWLNTEDTVEREQYWLKNRAYHKRSSLPLILVVYLRRSANPNVRPV